MALSLAPISRPLDPSQNRPFSNEPSRPPTDKLPTLFHPSSMASSESPKGDPMDVSPTHSMVMGPPTHNSPEFEANGIPVNLNGANSNSQESAGSNINLSAHGIGASSAEAPQIPKVVQTAFIHKLYNMLEDQGIRHLISWSSTNESFVMCPSSEFSKVLSQYFKHTNISSFVRQLNMYGFHKVSDVFHTGSPESTLWEFKHGNGNFKRGDLIGLREIKRRASRHALIHRDSFSTGPKAHTPQPTTPAEPVHDLTESRLSHLEHDLYSMHHRLSRSEENYAILSSRCQSISDSLTRCHQWSNDLAHYVADAMHDAKSPSYHDLVLMQKDIGRQIELLRSMEDPPNISLLTERQPYFSNLNLDSAPLSPHQTPVDDHQRRPSSTLLNVPRQITLRPPSQPPAVASARRYGSVSGSYSLSSSHGRQQLHSHQPPQYPPAPVSSPPTNTPRRHTSADIRQPAWGPVPPYSGPPTSDSWNAPSNRIHNPDENQQVRDLLAQYEIGRRSSYSSRQLTPPLTSDTTPSATSADSAWSFASSKFQLKPPFCEISAPATRRSSMASNVHSLLNPAETAEREDEDDLMNDDRKRKRLQ
ncbi:MAG: hypothetical protein M1829_005866 [Trizodia sp. TS-e1964]|nr:MAG: hypothetical protein M1829_005866 [Trizodia sp. TS-e1964]